MTAPDSTGLDDATADLLAEARALLETERRALLDVVGRVPVGDRSRRPGEGRWSIVEILEHLARVEKGVARLLVVKGTIEAVPPESERVPAPPLTPQRIAATRSREVRIEAPDRVRPAGTSTPEEALAALHATRGSLLQAIDGVHPLALHAVVHEHAVLGPLDLLGWIQFIPHHEARHVAQAEEVAELLRQSQGR